MTERWLLTYQTRHNSVRKFDVHHGDEVKFPSVTRVYGGDQKFNLRSTAMEENFVI